VQCGDKTAQEIAAQPKVHLLPLTCSPLSPLI